MRLFSLLLFLAVVFYAVPALADGSAQVESLSDAALIALTACQVASYGLRRAAPQGGFLHTAAGAWVLSVASLVATAAAGAIQAHGLDRHAILMGVFSAIASFLATSNPSTPIGQAPLLARKSDPALVLAVLFFMAVPTGCAPAYAGIYAGLATAELTVGVAAREFPALDKAKRDAIVASATSEADGKAKLADWDVMSDKLTKAIVGTDASVRLARDAVAEIAAGKRNKTELSGWIATAIELGIDIKNVLAASGVPLKGI